MGCMQNNIVMPYGNLDLGQHWSSKGLLPECTKPLPETMMTTYQWSLAAFTRGQSPWKYFRYLPLIWVWKLLLQKKLQPHLPGANELIIVGLPVTPLVIVLCYTINISWRCIARTHWVCVKWLWNARECVIGLHDRQSWKCNPVIPVECVSLN